MDQWLVMVLSVGGLALGIFMLVKGSNLFIDNAAVIAKRFGVSDHIIGLTLVAFATSVPELAVSVGSAVQGHTDLALGNVVGSNVANICLVLGLSLALMPVVAGKESFRDALIMTGITLLLYLFILIFGVVDRIAGVIFLTVFAVFTLYVLRGTGDEMEEEIERLDKEDKLLKEFLLLVVGVVGVVGGAQLLIMSATEIALHFGVSELIIGITIVAFGTSLPELASSAAAALKKRYGIAVGNVIGSNIMNIALVLGAASVIRPIPLNDTGILWTAFPMLIGVSCLTLVVVKIKPPRWVGVVLLALYGVFLWMLVGM